MRIFSSHLKYDSDSLLPVKWSYVVKPCMGPPISCPFTLLPSVTTLLPLSFFSTLQIVQAHLSLVAFALDLPWCQGLFLHSLLHLISSHHSDLSWKIGCSGRISLTMSLPPLILCHITLLYMLLRTSHYLTLSYAYICMLSAFYKYEFHGNRKCVCLENRISPVIQEVLNEHLLDKKITQWVATKIIPF